MSNVPKGIAANYLPPLQYFFVDNGPCPQGPPGPTGPTGPIGFSGLGQGATGATGASGPPGTVGATGPQGAQGPTGVQGNAGAPFLGIGQTGLAGPPGATGVRGVAGGVTIAGDPHGVVVGATNNNIGLASSNVTYSQSVAVNNSTLNVNGNMAPNLLLWTKSAFGVPQTGTASGTNSSAPVPSGNLLTLSLNIVNADTGYSLMDAPAVLFIANMSTSNTLVNPISSDPYTPTIINSTNFYMNGKYAGRIIQFPANRINPAVKLWQTRQFFTILYRGVDYGPGLSSNAYFFCQTQTATGIDSSQTALGAWNLYMSVAGLYQ